MKHVIVEGWHYGVTIRESGVVDFYFNFIKVSSTEKEKEENGRCYNDVDINFDAIFIKHKDE
jgi:hypothetical protein